MRLCKPDSSLRFLKWGKKVLENLEKKVILVFSESEFNSIFWAHRYWSQPPTFVIGNRQNLAVWARAVPRRRTKINSGNQAPKNSLVWSTVSNATAKRLLSGRRSKIRHALIAQLSKMEKSRWKFEAICIRLVSKRNSMYGRWMNWCKKILETNLYLRFFAELKNIESFLKWMVRRWKILLFKKNYQLLRLESKYQINYFFNKSM